MLYIGISICEEVRVMVIVKLIKKIVGALPPTKIKYKSIRASNYQKRL